MKARFYVLLVLILIILLLGSGAVVWLTDWIWLRHLGYADIMLKSIGYKLACGIAAAAVTFVIVYLNLSIVLRSFRRPRILDIGADGRVLENKWATWLALVISIALAAVYGLSASNRWLDVLSFFNPVSFGVDEPLHGIDVSFYVFRLPALRLLHSYALSLLIVVGFLAFIGYLASGSVSFAFRQLRMAPSALAHIALLIALVFLVQAGGYWLNTYDLVFSTRGMIYGAGYTDARVIQLGYKIMAAVTVVAAAAVLVDAAFRRLRFLVPTILCLIAVSLVFNGLIPGIVERFYVKPNQAQLESTYIANHITMTRAAYGLDVVEEAQFSVSEDLTVESLIENYDVISNIRLWDWRPLLDTYTQTQSNKAYYQFDEVDVDRYMIDGEYRQVMLSGREMNPDAVPGEARNWINRHLVYTHGYGIVMSYATEITDEGFPVYVIQGIPPVSEPGLEVERPQIYYGERTDYYAIVNNNYGGVGEFDYPAGDRNAYIKYDGDGGISLASPLVKVLFALRFRSTDILLADAITSESRIMIYRNIAERVTRIAPFLRYDSDPYLVLADGRLFWIIDAYTVTDRYPYSTPYRGWGNYVRNSVKVVVDAYHGSVKYYRWDEDDPIAEFYSKAFPGFFSDLSDLSSEIKAHFRYPETLFAIQARILGTYHMTDVSMFYNKEDQWQIPMEQYQSVSAPVQPYYMITRLPGSDVAEYVLMIPYSPVGKNNMTALFVAGCDGDRYGRLTLYRLPRGETVRGPLQIENLIDGDDQISRDLTLWNQQGSRVIRGNLMVVPVANSLLYVEPIFLEPEGTPFPVLKRVAVSYAGRVVAEPSLRASLDRLFGSLKAPASGETPIADADDEQRVSEPSSDRTSEPSAEDALRVFNEAREAVQSNDWAAYGRKLDELETILNQLVKESAFD